MLKSTGPKMHGLKLIKVESRWAKDKFLKLQLYLIYVLQAQNEKKSLSLSIKVFPSSFIFRTGS